MKFGSAERRPRGFSDVQGYHIRTESRRGKKRENPCMSVDAALSLGCFIKLLVTFELDGGEEVRLGELSDVQSLPSICTDAALCIFNFSSAAVPCGDARLWQKS